MSDERDEAIDRLEVRVGLIPGGAFILDAPAELQAVWGRGQEVAWSKGEPLLIVGGIGAGKSTIAQQLTLARLGLVDDVLGMPVAPSERHVLYLACDRPAQIQRSLRRMVKAEWRDILDDRLKVWKGPPPADCAKHPRTLLEMAQDADADTVIVDSLKDIALKLTDDETGSGLNQAHQYLVSSGVEYLGLHHQRKGREGGKPTKLEDVYGSTWITAGAGSVILLWGEPGDAYVELSHLKPAADPIGPLDEEYGPQHPSSWQRQPDCQQLAQLDPTLVHRAREEAERLVLADHPGAVLALAVLLLERGKVRGRLVRRVLLYANEYEQEPSLEGDRLPRGYIENSIL